MGEDGIRRNLAGVKPDETELAITVILEETHGFDMGSLILIVAERHYVQWRLRGDINRISKVSDFYFALFVGDEGAGSSPEAGDNCKPTWKLILLSATTNRSSAYNMRRSLIVSE
jgi:hypothetical protein